jgi:succinyl-CoA synthetase beta subunit
MEFTWALSYNPRPVPNPFAVFSTGGSVVKIHEYQAKAILKRFGVPVPEGDVANSPDEARAIAEKLGGRVVVKSQIHAGGRGKGTFRDKNGETVARPGDGDRPLGGVILADDAAGAEVLARGMLGNVLVTRQSGPVLDRATRSPVFIASAEGGTEIEEVAAERPEAILRVAVDPKVGFSPWIGRKIAFGLGLEGKQVSAAVKLTAALYRTFMETDASLAEINPLILTGDGRVLALDAKMNFDDNALYRHPDIKELRDLGEEDPLEVEASKYGLNYITLDGNVGCMVNGAGLAMSTMDIIKHHGGSPANFLDAGGGATTEMITAAFRILLSDENVKAVLINIFGGIMRCDVVAEGVVAAAKAVGIEVPVVIRLEGTNVDQGKEILKESGLTFEVADSMRDAAEKVVAAAEGR